MAEVKEQVREFYDRVGWQRVSGDQYQNARYEDLRPVSREYIHRCHLRVNRHLSASGMYLLDAGSGPVQYEEYLTYSKGYRYRVCLDLSIVALQEARQRLGEHGLFVVADVSRLPFAVDAFDGVVSLHTLHHLRLVDQKKAYLDLHRVLKPGKSGVVVNGWTDSRLMRLAAPLINLAERIGRRLARSRNKSQGELNPNEQKPVISPSKKPTGTFVQKLNASWLRQELSELVLDVYVWRSLNVRFLRALVHATTGGRLFLKLVYRLEEWFPRFFGENGQYPLIVIRKKQ